MDLQQFVRETLTEIVLGVNAAQDQVEVEASGARINPAGIGLAATPDGYLGNLASGWPVFVVDFDLAVTVSGIGQGEAAPKVQVVSQFTSKLSGTRRRPGIPPTESSSGCRSRSDPIRGWKRALTQSSQGRTIRSSGGTERSRKSVERIGGYPTSTKPPWVEFPQRCASSSRATETTLLHTQGTPRQIVVIRARCGVGCSAVRA